MNLLPSLVFTALLEEPEFRRLSTESGSLLVSDAVLRVELDQKADPTITTWQVMCNYIADVTDHGRCAPGIWSRYVATLKEKR